MINNTNFHSYSFCSEQIQQKESSLIIFFNFRLPLFQFFFGGVSTDKVFPSELRKELSNNYQYKTRGELHIGDDTALDTIGAGDYGVLRGVILCVGLIYPLISVNYLTKTLGYLVEHCSRTIEHSYSTNFLSLMI